MALALIWNPFANSNVKISRKGLRRLQVDDHDSAHMCAPSRMTRFLGLREKINTKCSRRGIIGIFSNRTIEVLQSVHRPREGMDH